MSFLHPLFLYGLAGVAVPVLIHLIGRRRARRVLFPSLRLLHAAQRKRRTIPRLQRLLSLLLRVLAVALLSLGLATPIVGPVPPWLPVPRPTALALVFDDSASMAGRPFERARTAADRVLGAQRTGDRIAVVSTSSPGGATWEPPSAARRRVPALRPTALTGKMAPALLAAARTLEANPAPNRAVVVLTDLQASGWREPPADAKGLGSAGVVVVDTGEREAANLAVDALDLRTAVPLVGRSVRLSARLATSGPWPAGARRTVAQFLVEGGTVATATHAFAAGVRPESTREAASMQFAFVPRAPRDTPLQVSLAGGPYGIPADDTRYGVVRARPALAVLIVTPGGDGSGPGFYLSAALDPPGSLTPTGIAPLVVRPDDLASALGRRVWDLVILAHCRELTAAGLEALAWQVQEGVGVLAFLGGDIDRAHYAGRLIPRLTGDRSVAVGAPVKASESAPFTVSEVNTSREPLTAFANPRAGDLGSLRFSQVRSLRAGPAAEVLAEFDNGAPALVEWPTDRGHVALLNTSADASWGDHVRSPAYLPLLHRLAQYLARPARPTVADILVGERAEIQGVAKQPPQVALVSPGGVTETVRVEDGLLPEVKEPGIYRVRWDRHDLAFAANMDPGESDVTRTTESDVRRALAPARVTFAGPEEVGEVLREIVAQRADLSWPLILLALALMLFEAVFSIVRQDTGGDVPRPVADF